ncbi:MAG: IS630 family transposase [Candidatus Dormibacteria bacterium]
MPHAAAPALRLSSDQRTRLELWARSRTLPQRQVQRAKVILLAAEGHANTTIGRQVGCSKPTVLLWRQRFVSRGLDGLEDAPGRGRPCAHGEDLVERVLSTTMSAPPPGYTHWSSRRLASACGVSATTVRRIWRDHRLQPHRSRSFKFSQDPQLEAEVTDVVGLYLHPPEKAVVLAVDEKTQVETLDRTQPVRPMRPGQVERRTHDDLRHGTTTLFAALDVATGNVTGRCYARHRHEEFLRFLQLVARRYPRGQIHFVLDNYATHKHPEVQEWLCRHPRFHLHFTPTSASWMNQVEGWFAILHRAAIRRGVFHNLAALRTAIERFLNAWNDNCHPFAWVKTPEQILAKANRQVSSGSVQ